MHLILPVVEIAVEVRPVDHLGVMVLGGIGSIRPTNSTESFAVKELGVQVVGYPLAAFDSLTVGAELLYVHVAGTGEVTGVASGVAVGPLVGYKWIARGGFTLLVQGGAQYAAIRSSEGDSDQRVFPLVNFNLGWSF